MTLTVRITNIFELQMHSSVQSIPHHPHHGNRAQERAGNMAKAVPYPEPLGSKPGNCSDDKINHNLRKQWSTAFGKKEPHGYTLWRMRTSSCELLETKRQRSDLMLESVGLPAARCIWSLLRTQYCHGVLDGLASAITHHKVVEWMHAKQC
jgi:hypothetical protein